ncbi:hypothetical protein DSQ19_06865 [Candidatus Nitrosotenuis sp. DW1]|nr:hypothetical protein DSQ19_06865 [Candidatus Nitrosotenuis sp. DW1]
MQPANKTRIALMIGIGLIISVASLITLPFMNSQSSVEKVSHETLKKIESSEKKSLVLPYRKKQS